MITEIYKGRKIRIVKGRGRDFGYSRVTLNGTELSKWLGDEARVLQSLHGYIDVTDRTGINGDKYGVEWYAPGTFEVCENGHPKEIGGECLHSYCIERRPVTAPSPETPTVQSLADYCGERETLTGNDFTCTLVGPHMTHQAQGSNDQVVYEWPVVTEYSVKIWYRSGAYEGAPHCLEDLARKIYADAAASAGVEFAELHGPSGILVESKTPNEEQHVSTEPDPYPNAPEGNPFMPDTAQPAPPLVPLFPMPAPGLPQEPEPTA